MTRLAMIVTGAAVGLVVAVSAFTVYISLNYPNNSRDSGLPNFAVAIVLAGPIGGIVGAIIGAVVPRTKRP